MEYLNLEIKIGSRMEQGYPVIARSDAIGEVHGIFAPLPREDQLDLLLKVGVKRRGVRGIRSAEWRAAREYGEKLFRALLKEQVFGAFVSSHNAALRQRKGLRVNLILDAPELNNYPWEFLYDPYNGQFLSLFEDTPIVRYVELARPILPLEITPPLCVLAIASSPRNYEPLDVAREQRNLRTALEPLIQRGQVQLEFLKQATLDALRQQLLERAYHVLHFIGHGSFDQAKQDGILIFEDEEQRGREVSGERLAIILGNQRTLRLVVLNACEGARTSEQDPFAGTAMTLVRTGNLPAVVAMQFEISDGAAIDFAKGFYGAIAVGRPVDAAMGQGRQAIFANDNDVEWSTPVLYLRAVNGLVFQVDTSRVAEDAKRTEEQLERERAEQERLEREGIVREQAQQRATFLNDLLQKGKQALDEGDPFTATALLGQLIQEDSTFQSVANPLRERANQEMEVARKRAEDQAAQERVKQEQLAREKLEAERAAKEQAEQQRLAREKLEQDVLARAQQDVARAQVVATREESKELSTSTRLATRLGIVVLFFALASAFSGAEEMSQYFVQRQYFNADFGTYALLPAIVIAGALGGWMLSLAFRLVAPSMSNPHIVMLIIGWGAAFFLTALFGTDSKASNVSQALVTESLVTGVVGGLIIGFVLWQSRIVDRWQWLVGIVAAMIVGFSFPWVFRDIYYGVWEMIKNAISEDTYQMEILRVGIWQFIFGAIGPLASVAVLFAYLKQRRRV